MPEIPDVLDAGTRCVLACEVAQQVGGQRLGVAASAFWSDGTGVWLALPADGPVVAGLRRHGGCRLAVLPPEPDGAGAVVDGVARVHGLHDPVGLAIHAPTLTAAMAALAARNAATVAAAVQDVTRDPSRYLPRNVVAVRVTVEQVVPVAWPAPAGAVTPALPAVVPAEIRRGVAGRHDIVLATLGPDGVEVGPAAWGAGFALTGPAGRGLPPGMEAAAVVEGPLLTRGWGTGGLALLGELVAGPALRAREALWWRGFEQARAELPAAAGVTLPD